MEDPSFSPVHPADRARALATLVLAFAADPLERWMFPDAQQFLTDFEGFLAVALAPALENKTVWQAGDFGAVVVWLPPGVPGDGAAAAAALAGTVPGHKHADVFAVHDQMTAFRPDYPHWYLAWLGVDPRAQDRGLGSRLLAATSTVVDASGLPAYLESPNPRNVPFYERHRFRVVGSARAGECPPVTFMLRDVP